MSKKFEINIKTIFSKAGIVELNRRLQKTVSVAKAAGHAGAAAFRGIHKGVKLALAPMRMLRNGFMVVTAAMAGTVVAGARFNVQMARVWSMVGGGINNFKALRKEARGLSADFGIAGAEMAKGMYNALSAGVERSNLETFMRSAAQVAVADGSEISVAVDGITTVLNAFGIDASKTEQVTDQLFQTVKMGKTTFGELAASLSNTASVAAASGIPLEQILAHIAALTAQGTPTAQATTQIRQSIIGLNKALGDGWSKSMSFQEALKKVWEKSGKSQTALLKLVGSSEAVQAVLGGVGEKAVMAAKKLDGMKDSAGAAKESFDEVNQFRHWPTLLETARAALAKFGAELDARIRPAVQAITLQIQEWTKSDNVWTKIGAGMDAVRIRTLAAIKTVQEVAANIHTHFASGGEGLGKLINTFITNAIAVFFNAFMAALKASIAIWKVFGSVVASAIKEELMKLDVWGMKGFRQKAAKETVKGMSEEDAKEFLAENTGRSQEVLQKLGEQGVSFKDMLFADINLDRLGVGTEAKLANQQDGKATEAAFKGFADGLATAGKDLKKDLKDAGKNLSESITKITGKETDIDQIYQSHLVKEKEKSTRHEWTPADQQMADEFTQRNEKQERDGALQQAQPLYRQQQQQERDAAAAGAPNRSGPAADAARETLERERGETAEVAALIRAVQEGDNGLVQQMLTALQSVVQNQNQMAVNIEQNARQIKNGRS